MTATEPPKPVPAWGHSSGLLDIRSDEPLDPGLLADRMAIIERMYRYAWSFDERQRDMLGECFAKDATWEASFMGATTIGPFEGRSAVVVFMTSFWADQLDQRRHMIMNPIVVDQGPSEATVLTYHLLVSTTSQSGVVPVTTGFYSVAMRKTSKGLWKIRKLVAGYDVPF